MSVKHHEVFGITESLAKEILEAALATGGDFAEVYMEETTNETLQMRQGKLASANVSKVKGAAVRVIKDGIEVSASVTVCTPEKLLETAKVAVVPGTGFSAPEYVRWSYATSMDNCEEGLNRLKKFLNNEF
jgi:predicted Zn-dependent protease